MTKKIVKRTDANNETLYFYTHSDAVDVGEGSSTKSLTEVIDDTLHKSAQTLTNAEKTQVYANLGLNGVDDVPTENSNNIVRSGGVKAAIDDVIDDFTNRGFMYKGIAPASAPLGEDKTFYIAKSGDYTAYTGIGDGSFTLNGIAVLTYATTTASGAWTKNDIVLFDEEPTSGSNNLVKSGGVYETKRDFTWDVVEDYPLVDFAILESGKFGNSSDNKHTYIGVNAGEKYLIKTTLTNIATYAFATNNKASAGHNIPLVSGTAVGVIPVNASQVVTIPDGCEYLLVYNAGNSRPFDIRAYFNIAKSVSDNNKLPTNTAVNTAVNTINDIIGSTVANTVAGFFVDFQKILSIEGNVCRVGVQSGLYYSLRYVRVKRGDILNYRLKLANNTDVILAVFPDGVYNMNYPSEGDETTEYKRINIIENEYSSGLYFVPFDGLLVIFLYDASTSNIINFWFTKSVDELVDISSYVEDKQEITLTTKKIIDAATWSGTFGDIIDAPTINTYGVSDYINVDVAKYIKISSFFTRATAIKTFADNNPYKFGSVFYDANKEPISAVNNVTVVSNGYPDDPFNDCYFDVPENAVYFRYFAYNSTKNTIVLLKDDVAKRIAVIEDKIDNIDYEANVKNIIKQAKYYSGAVPTLNLLHMSDIHGDTQAANYFKDFINKNTSLIDDAVMTGDVAFYLYDSTSDESTSAHGEAATHGYKWWTEITRMAEKCLFVLGNHDCQIDSNNPNGMGRDWAYETYFKPFVSTLGMIQPTGVEDSDSPNYHACYWYKDYVAQKIRIIGLDCMNRYDGTIDVDGNPIADSWVDNARNDQEVWLKNKLAETLNSENAAYGYSVIFLCHYPLEDFEGRNEEWSDTNHRFTYNQKAIGGCVMNEITNSPTVFHDKRTNAYTANARHHMHNRTTSRFTKGTFNYIGDIIQEWVNSGGKYVAWICGHTHVDYMWYPKTYPTLLNVVIDKAGYSRGSDIADRESGNARYCANYYSIDTALGLFKIVRIGLTSNKYLDRKEMLCYDYINKKVLNEE